jgi:large-conductance mechanosensitive channel
MKLTKTQENFRREMKDVKGKIDIYDTTRKGNPFYNYEGESLEWKNILFGIISFILLASLIFGIYLYFNYTTTSQERLSSISETQQTDHKSKYYTE